MYEESFDLYDEMGDERGRAVLLHRFGILAMQRQDLAKARELVEESHAIHEHTTIAWGLAQTVGTLGAIERDAGNGESAYALIADSADRAEAVGVLWWQAGMLVELAALSLEAGRLEDAEAKARESLELANPMRDYGGRVFGVGVLACVAAERSELSKAGAFGARSRNIKSGRRSAAGCGIVRPARHEFSGWPAQSSKQRSPADASYRSTMRLYSRSAMSDLAAGS